MYSNRLLKGHLGNKAINMTNVTKIGMLYRKLSLNQSEQKSGLGKLNKSKTPETKKINPSAPQPIRIPKARTSSTIFSSPTPGVVQISDSPKVKHAVQFFNQLLRQHEFSTLLPHFNEVDTPIEFEITSHNKETFFIHDTFELDNETASEVQKHMSTFFHEQKKEIEDSALPGYKLVHGYLFLTTRKIAPEFEPYDKIHQDISSEIIHGAEYKTSIVLTRPLMGCKGSGYQKSLDGKLGFGDRNKTLMFLSENPHRDLGPRGQFLTGTPHFAPCNMKDNNGLPYRAVLIMRAYVEPVNSQASPLGHS